MLNVEGTRIGEEDVMLLEPLVGLTSLDLSSTVVGDAIADTLACANDCDVAWVLLRLGCC